MSICSALFSFRSLTDLLQWLDAAPIAKDALFYETFAFFLPWNLLEFVNRVGRSGQANGLFSLASPSAFLGLYNCG